MNSAGKASRLQRWETHILTAHLGRGLTEQPLNPGNSNKEAQNDAADVFVMTDAMHGMICSKQGQRQQGRTGRVTFYWISYCLDVANYKSLHSTSLHLQADQISTMPSASMVARHDASDSALEGAYWAAV